MLNFIKFLMNKTFALIGLIFLMITSSCNTKQEDGQVKKQATKNDSTGTVSSHYKTIIFFGNSLTAGYGLDPTEAFPSLIQNKIDSLKLNYKVINAGVSGETSAGGLGRIDWILRQPVDIFVLEL